MTPKKKETFSRVRTTLADCQEADRDVTRLESWYRRVRTHNIQATWTHLDLEVLDLSLQVLSQKVPRQILDLQILDFEVLDLEGFLCLQLQPITVFLQFPLEEVDM